jgi:hypothetical protein
MSLTAVSTLSGSTIAGTGGTAVNWTKMGQVGNKVSLAVTSDADLRSRRTLDVVAKAPSVNPGAPNGYTQARVTKVYKQPLLLENGSITVNTVKVEVAYDVETSAAEIQELVDQGAQLLFDADLVSVDKTLSLS